MNTGHLIIAVCVRCRLYLGCRFTLIEIGRLLPLISSGVPTGSGSTIRLSIVSSVIVTCKGRRCPVRGPAITRLVRLCLRRGKVDRGRLTVRVKVDLSQIGSCVTKHSRPTLGVTHLLYQMLGVPPTTVLNFWVRNCSAYG